MLEGFAKDIGGIDNLERLRRVVAKVGGIDDLENIVNTVSDVESLNNMISSCEDQPINFNLDDDLFAKGLHNALYYLYEVCDIDFPRCETDRYDKNFFSTFHGHIVQAIDLMSEKFLHENVHPVPENLDFFKSPGHYIEAASRKQLAFNL